MADKKPDVVILPAAWHTPPSYAKFEAALEREGFKVHLVELPSVLYAETPERSNADFRTDCSAVRDIVEELSKQGIQTIVFMHAYGGNVGVGALGGLGAGERASQGQSGGVVHSVFLSSFILPEDISIEKYLELAGLTLAFKAQLDIREDGLVVYRSPKMLLVGDDFSDAATEEYLKTWRPWRYAIWQDKPKPLVWTEGPVTYLQTRYSRMMPLKFQQESMDTLLDAGASVNIVTLDTAHEPNVTATEELVKVVKDVASKAAPSISEH